MGRQHRENEKGPPWFSLILPSGSISSNIPPHNMPTGSKTSSENITGPLYAVSFSKRCSKGYGIAEATLQRKNG